jgi:hypothetical protein
MEKEKEFKAVTSDEDDDSYEGSDSNFEMLTAK